MFKKLLPLLFLFAGLQVNAAVMFYDDKGAFESSLDSIVIDDYSNTSYTFMNTDAAMSSVLGETDYKSTQYANFNLVQSFDTSYCSGCNGSFLLSFTTTSVGTAEGVYGAGFDVLFNSADNPYYAFTTYADGSTTNDLLSTGFFGITADVLIESIHMGLSGGAKTNGGSFALDNLTIGTIGGQVPEPAIIALFGLGLVGIGFARRRQS